jgi:trk system potassium uptake protein TrkH
MGVVVLAVAILPFLGVGGRQIFRAETPGPMKESKLTARIGETAKGLWVVYSVITVSCVLAFWAAGMSFIDALIHAFGTMSLGGYSSHDASFGYFDSPLLETVAVFFMVVAGINFSTHFLALYGGSLRPYRRDPELLGFVLVLLISCWGVAVFLWWSGTYPDLLTAARFATFNVVSIATTTGFANTDYNTWPIFAPLWMLALCCFATCSGSTGGGIKMIRAEVLVLNTARLLKHLVHPRATRVIRVHGLSVPDSVTEGMLAFMLLFGGTTVLATLLLAATGLDFTAASTAAVACITNTGPGLGVVGPAGNYASLTDFQKWTCTATMLLGRLELLTLLVVFTPAFWKR